MKYDGKVPQYPLFVEYKHTWRRLALWSGSTLITEEGVPIDLSSYEQFKEVLFDCELLLFVPSLPDFPYFNDMILDENAQVTASPKDHEAINARIQQGKCSRWIVQVDRWPLELSKKDAEKPKKAIDYLQKMKLAYSHCDVGTKPTPGSLGQALMRKSWKEQYPGRGWMFPPPSYPLDILWQLH